ncbi:MAG: decaprenyl-phosphate phosphoribosyltransferase [Chloroflexaceae bacterium]|nr:decaprenyl-phosphate phosphoribosyltransferase [Chloroflexaceae bacterium]
MERPISEISFPTVRTRAGTLKYLLLAMRPHQWIKNLFVFAAIAFSEQRLWLQLDQLLVTVAAFGVFCMAASVIYLINDLVDIEKDRAHPRKCRRPLASGKISPSLATATAVVLTLAVLPLAYLVDRDFGFLTILLGYVIVQGVLYSYWLKNIVIVDILTIAAGFVLRAVAGVVVLDVTMTPWLLVCMGLLALFLAIGKRRHELILLEQGAGEHRRILNEYSVPMLDQMMSIVTASIIMAYSMTTFSAPAVPREPYPLLMVTIPFVVYGIFRYLYLIYQRDGGGSPDEVVLKDMPLAGAIVLWGITVLVIMLLFHSS